MFGKWKKRTAQTQDITSLLKASLQGSTQAFETIVERYQSLVCAVTYSGTGSVERSEELAQETFLRAWKSLDQLQDLAKFRSWLCSIARSTVQNWFRSRKNDVVGKAAPLDCAIEKASDDAGPMEAAMMNEQQAVVARALAHIPESLREPLILFYREQKSVREVAEQLGLSENAARQRISRARSMLREQVAAMVETTITRTKPGKAFTTAVMIAIAASAAKTVTTAAAATGFAVVVTGSSGTAPVLSGLTAKVIALAAGVVIIAGGVVAYKHLAKPEQSSVASSRSSVGDSTGPEAQPEVKESQASLNMPQSMSPVANREPGADNQDSELAAPPAKQDRPRFVAAAGQTRPYEFAPKGVLSGVITDAETGEPVRDALVRVSMSRIFDTRTDANGFYWFQEVHEAGNFDIAIDSKEYVGISVGDRNPVVHLSQDRQAVRHFQLPRACMVDLWVVDSNGAGVKGAKVVATSPADSRSRPVSYFGDLRETDPNGYILLGGFPPAETDYLITAWHQVETLVKADGGIHIHRTAYDCAPGKATVRLTDRNVVKQVQMVLERGQQVHGYVQYADGVPASDIEIVARPAWWHCNYGVQGDPVNPDGTFSLKHVTPGMYDICAEITRSDGAVGTIRTILQAQLPPADNEPLIVRLSEKSPQSLVAISGRFAFVGDKRPDNIQIAAYSPSAGHVFTNVGYEPTGGAKDTFLLDRLEPGTYRLTFSGNGMEDKVVEDVVAPASDLVVELAYASKPMLKGTVTNAKTGEPVRKFRARARKLQTLRGANYVQEDRWTYFENERGDFSVEAVGPGIYQVQAAAEGYAPAWSPEVSTDSTDPITLALTSGATLAGRVIDAGGRPITGAKVIPLSIAGGVMSSTKDTIVSEDGAVETVDGEFKLLNLPTGDETLKVTHPDYTPGIVENVRVVEGATTQAIEVVLLQGGTVEGYVYNDKGVPLANEALRFQDSSGYSGSGDEEAGRLGAAVTDSNGFYRVSHLPEKPCYVKRMDEWKGLGVVARAVVPRNGEVVRLDFGGTPVVSGSIVIDGVPLAATRVLLGPADSPHFGMFKCYAVTDEHGAFAFAGAAPGTHGIYYEQPQKQNQWLKIATITVKSADIDLGVIPGNVAKLFITFNTPATDSGWTIEQVFLSQGKGVYAAPLRTAEAPPERDKPWVISNVEPGRYTLMVMLRSSVQWRKEIELEPGRNEWRISLDVPKLSANLSGHIIGDKVQTAVLWREHKDVVAGILSSADGVYAVDNLPAGRYFVGDNLSLLYDLPAIAEFTLAEGESKTLDLDLSAKPKAAVTMVTVQVVDETGSLRNDAEVRLAGPQGVIEPAQSASTGYIFLTTPGDQVLRVEAPGYKPVSRNVTLKDASPRPSKSQTITIRLDKR